VQVHFSLNRFGLTVLFLIGPVAAVGQDLPAFPDVAREAGLTLVNVSGGGTNDYIVEANGNGAAFFDYDNDGDMDLLITNGSTLTGGSNSGGPMAALYENDGGAFNDVTTEARIDSRGWAFAVCVADYDNDGHQDFYLTAYGANRLYRNNGNGTFEERALEAGLADMRWGSNCAFGDHDRDGFVDLYVAHYLDFDVESIARRGTEACVYMGTLPVFCGPRGLEATPDVLYRNTGDGTFLDVSASSGISGNAYFGLGVVFSDFDGDAWPDIYVANDSVPNLLFHNDGGRFEEVGLLSGAALNLYGTSQAGMGIAVGDYDGDADMDIYVTNFADDTNTLYENLGDMFFSDVTAASGASRVSRPNVGWGTAFLDLDNDGWLDLFVANGHVYPDIDTLTEASHYRQPKEVYRNRGDKTFEGITARLDGDLMTPHSSRGAAFGDYDNDGDIDVVVVNAGEPPSLYRNDGGNRNHWIGFHLVGTSGNRDAIGARIEIDAGGRTQAGEVRSGGSYLSHNDMRVHFGLGDVTTVDRVRVRWPGGEIETFDAVDADQYVTLEEGR